MAKALTLQDQDNSLQNTLICVLRFIFSAHILFATVVAMGRIYGRFLSWLFIGY